ncbi:unnamed protein product [Didymodactylos carnosus]|uniref:Uncharacterized protein n=1 Tax=Didymodactylos carnosus TaxID=1234261 RepID=A0A814S4N9_9BILA|nr:unnamed protein product [Didymodactylos carnosus]CAF1180403.1 unnamed protein product [Didymodactylos carnosus]CAF3906806.1 unnamed protein product [Didymodactylos carnosus]CAF3991699.1 unnamed protein product [Didymodactylos carnosus]
MSMSVPTYRSHSTTFTRQNITAVPTSDKNRINMTNDKRNTSFLVPVPPSPRLINSSSTAQDGHQQFRYSQIPPTTSLPSISSTSSTGITSKPRSMTSPKARLQSIDDADSEEKTNPKLYMFSNRPRVLNLQQQQQSKYLSCRIRSRVSSAPDENSLQQPSPPSSAVAQKPSSANGTIQPQQQTRPTRGGSATTSNHSYRKLSTNKTDENHFHPGNNEQLNTTHRYRLVKVDKKHQQTDLAQQTRSKVPDAVQKRRMLVLFRTKPTQNVSTNEHRSLSQQYKKDYLSATSRSSMNNSSNILKQSTHSPDLRPHLEQRKISVVQQPLVIANTISTWQQSSSSSSSSSSVPSQLPVQNQLIDQEQGIDTLNKNGVFEFGSKAEFMDSDGMKAMLIDINKLDGDDFTDSLLKTTPKTDNQIYSPTRQQTKRLDPTKYEYIVDNSLDNTTTTLKVSPRPTIHFSSQYRHEMRLSSNTKAPQLLSSIVTDSGSQSDNLGRTLTLRLNTTTMKKQNSLDDVDPLEDENEDDEDEQIALCYDEILNCYYDPETKIYYELQST